MSEHSPGPWRVDPLMVAVVDSGSRRVVDLIVGGSMADARIIAAAPEMLALVKRAADPSTDHAQLMCDAMDLLAKTVADARPAGARGESPADGT